ncbi:sialidase family protein [Portibacter marinus]|uniref:sialidase family protein n=1 Tax=Portibacter marinus TaxID=2898660 RepID=UPI001F2A34D7|nr:sialidase family protein [Portibacter marinus]
MKYTATTVLIYLMMVCSIAAQDFELLFDSEDLDKGCYRIPAIATANNGHVLVAIDERVGKCDDLRSHEDINIVIRRSFDHGKTWQPLEKIIDFPNGQSASDPSFIVDHHKGAIFLFYNYMDVLDEPNQYYFHMTKSLDNGATWTKPIDITPQISKDSWAKDFKFITSGRGIQTKQGWLLHTLVHLEKGAFVYGSVDNGEAWSLMSGALSPGDESKIVELDDGRWMVNSRVNKAGMRWIHISNDQGKTWISEQDPNLIDPSCNASLINKNGMLYFSNAFDNKERKNLSLHRSADAGQSWQEIELIYNGPAAYSTMDFLNTGEIGIVFEKDNYTEVVFKSISLQKKKDRN